MNYILNFLLTSLPEFYIITIWGMSAFGHPFSKIKYKALLIAFIVALSSDIMWAFHLFDDSRVIITFAAIGVFYKFLLQEKWIISMVMTVVDFTATLISEMIFLNIALLFVNYDDVTNNLWVKFLVTLTYLIPLVVISYIFNKKKFSFKQMFAKKFKNKDLKTMYFWFAIIFFVLLQLILIVFLNYTFYMNSHFIHGKVNDNILGLPLLSLGLIILNFAVIYTIIKIMNRYSKLEISRTETNYNEHLEKLITKLRMERHDFVNELQTIHGLVQAKMYDHLHEYTGNLVQNARDVNRVITIKNLTVSALLLTKIEQIESQGVEFNLKVNTNDSFSTIKSYDLVKIVSNLLDNALRAVKDGDSSKPSIEFFWGKDNSTAIIQVSNNGPVIHKNLKEKLFEEGFSTKKDKEKSGYGLSIVKSIIQKYKGMIEVDSTDRNTSFTVKLPL